MHMDFDGKKVFLTGGSGGIGRHIYKAFENEGGLVTAPSHDLLDLSSEISITRYLQTSSCDFDVFVHCAGINPLAGVEEINSKIMEDTYYINCIAPVLLLNRFINKMRERKMGRIVFLSSLYASVSRERRIAYSAAKSALSGIMKSMALELAKDGILVNCVAPGYVMTEMTCKNLSREEIDQIKSNIPTQRLQTADEIADVVMFLSSNRNKSITGQLITVDGGFLCR